MIDADIYGHSIPHMLGVHQRPIVVDKMIVPPVRGRLKLISIGNFLDDNAPVMWRGPMLHRALEQFLSDVHWGELDTIVIDMPPGTGDMAISLGQLLPRAEVLVVTTPQPLAQEVAARAAMMAQKTGQKLLGVVENMSGDAFGTGGGGKLADDLGVPLLGTVPLDTALREAGDAGVPVVEADPESESARAIVAIAEAVLASRPGSDPQAPDGSVLERRRAPAGALRSSSSLVELVALVNLRERPDAGDLDAGHLDLVLRVDALHLIRVLDGAGLVRGAVLRLDRDGGRADRVHRAADEQEDAGARRLLLACSRCASRSQRRSCRCRFRACRRSGRRSSRRSPQGCRTTGRRGDSRSHGASRRAFRRR